MSAATTLRPCCPDWRLLVAERDAGAGDLPGWEGAVAHLDGGCEDCREAAVAADPSLLFRRLRHVDAGAADVEAMRHAVASLRRASRVTPVEAGSETALEAPSGRRLGRAAAHRLRQAAAALLLTAAGLGAWFAGQDEPVRPAAVAGLQAAGTAAGLTEPWTSLSAPTATGAPRSADELASRPVVEGLSKPRAADVYQLGEEDLLVVMVVDETLDI